MPRAIWTGAVSFGLVSLSRYSVTVRQANLPTSEVRLVREADALLLVRRATADVVLSVDESEIENVNLLLRLAQEIDPALVSVPRVGARAA